MLESFLLDETNVHRIEKSYQAFREMALEKYQWHDEPVDFETLKPNVVNGFIRGVVVEDSQEEEPIQGFMLYVPEPHRAIEINVIHIPEELEWKSIIDKMMMTFLATIKDQPGWDAISYPMLGIQERFVLTAHWYGLKPIGQAIQKFDLVNEISLPILQKVHEGMEALPDGFSLIPWENKESKENKENKESEDSHWKPEYKEQLAEAIYESFSKSNDAKWDPRFQSINGGRKVVNLLEANQMGLLQPEITSILLEDKGETKEVVGFCFIVQTDVGKANIPLIGVRPSVRKRGLGKHLLRHSLIRMVRGIMEERFMIAELTATVDTDNYFALKMYRRMGFQETINYPHCYGNADTLRSSHYGRELFKEFSAPVF